MPRVSSKMMGVLLLALPLGLHAAGETQVNYAGARNSGRLDGQGLSARDQALGKAVVASGKGPTAFVVNPASLANMDMEFSFDQSSSYFNTRSVLGASYGTDRYGSLGLYGSSADLGSVEGTDGSGKSYSLRPSQWALGLGWGYGLPGGLVLGAAGRTLSQSFGTYGSKSANGVGLGLGWDYQGLSLGVANDNDQDLDGKVWLQQTRMALSYALDWAKSQRSQVMAQFDTGTDGQTFRGGLEHELFKVLALRGGLENPLGAEARSIWSAGLGFRYHAWSLDLAYSTQQLFGSSQRATLTWAPAKRTVQEPVAKTKALGR